MLQPNGMLRILRPENIIAGDLPANLSSPSPASVAGSVAVMAFQAGERWQADRVAVIACRSLMIDAILPRNFQRDAAG